ncbi:uncharacterized protein LY89DRAFT_674987 [Mollisia scopiformis]|uniref:F-box domain-containing protein n=1 Tax=Mollisia scopiformis TaxID=149040 RepID=A0A194WSE4_MOLSC|nr:uncharacterized protein LY89DRAFT_674987 [Mollisia scopiformis]KUJ10885.1 hypothetical protein LY89DRAFT_674987 [Mollisia scopiformis]
MSTSTSSAECSPVDDFVLNAAICATSEYSDPEEIEEVSHEPERRIQTGSLVITLPVELHRQIIGPLGPAGQPISGTTSLKLYAIFKEYYFANYSPRFVTTSPQLFGTSSASVTIMKLPSSNRNTKRNRAKQLSSLINKLPNELLLQIFKDLKPVSQRMLGLTSITLYKLYKEDFFQEKIYISFTELRGTPQYSNILFGWLFPDTGVTSLEIAWGRIIWDERTRILKCPPSEDSPHKKFPLPLRMQHVVLDDDLEKI